MLRRTVLVAASGLAACATPSVPAAALFYDKTELAPGRTFPSPLVSGTVNGRPTKIVVDTGAQVSVVDAKLAAEAGLEIAGSVEAQDPSGQAVAMKRTLDPKLAVEGLGPLPALPAAVVELPPFFAQLGVGAIISPQALADASHSAVLDLRSGQLRIVSGTAPAGESVDVCDYREGALDAKALVMTVRIDGIDTRVELDSGASRTFLVAGSEASKKLTGRSDATKSTATGAAGTIDVVTAPSVRVGSSGADVYWTLAVMPGEKDARCGYEGRLGIDWLRSCVLTVAQASASLTCE
jgi:hypothetical protein